MFQWFAELWNALTSIGGGTHSHYSQDWYSFLRDFQTAIAALIALISVLVGIRGNIRLQERAQAHEAAENRRLTSTVIVAELNMIKEYYDSISEDSSKRTAKGDPIHAYVIPKVPEAIFFHELSTDIGYLDPKLIPSILATYADWQRISDFFISGTTALPLDSHRSMEPGHFEPFRASLTKLSEKVANTIQEIEDSQDDLSRERKSSKIPFFSFAVL